MYPLFFSRFWVKMKSIEDHFDLNNSSVSPYPCNLQHGFSFQWGVITIVITFLHSRWQWPHAPPGLRDLEPAVPEWSVVYPACVDRLV